MIKYRIQQYLEQGGSFSAGVGLLEMAGSRSVTRFRPILNKAYVRQRELDSLRSELVRTLAQLPEEKAPPVVTDQFKRKPEDTPRITAIRGQAVTLHKERSDLKSRLLERAVDNPDKYSDEDRYEISCLIMDNVQALDTIYAQIRRFEDEGIEPADDEEMIRNETVAQMKQVYSLRPRISRLKKAVAAGDAPQSDLDTLEKELEELEQLLGL